MLDKILVPLDGSSLGELTLSYAAEVASHEDRATVWNNSPHIRSSIVLVVGRADLRVPRSYAQREPVPCRTRSS